MIIIYSENKCNIQAKMVDKYETKILVNGEPLIVIESQRQEEFELELSELLDKYKI